MARLGACGLDKLLAVHNTLYEGMTFDTVEQAAQELSQTLYREFRESVVLARTYLTVPFGGLPASNQKFVRELAATVDSSLLKDTTPVLTLAGTAGTQADWNDRRKSVGHVGIPLLSAAFVESIPMVARLMNEMGLGMSWIEDGDTSLLEKVLMSRMFYVPNASDAKDTKGRKVIPAQDFVKANNVKTVFGVGGSFIGSKTLVVLIIFANETVPKDVAQWFSCTVMKLVACSFPAMQRGAVLKR